MAIFSEANMISSVAAHLPYGQNFKAGIHAIVKEVKLRRFYSNAAYDSTANLIRPMADAPLLYITKGKESTFDAYIGYSEDCLVIVPCEQEMWHYENVEIDEPDLTSMLMQFAVNVVSPVDPHDILPIYHFSQIDNCEIKKNWVGAYVCAINFVNGDFIKILLPPLGGLFGGMPNHSSYRKAILELLMSKSQQHPATD